MAFDKARNEQYKVQWNTQNWKNYCGVWPSGGVARDGGKGVSGRGTPKGRDIEIYKTWVLRHDDLGHFA
jgi:hypothetical protein